MDSIEAPAWMMSAFSHQNVLLCLDIVLESSSSNSESDECHFAPRRGGSKPGKRPNKFRNRLDGAYRLHADYFAQDPVYDEIDFRRRFRMRKSLFVRVHNQVLAKNAYFTQRRDACGILGLNSFQKITAAVRMLAYGSPADQLDEVVRMGGQTILDSLREFTTTVISVFGKQYLRAPTQADLERILTTNANRGFPGMIGSVECMHWVWKNGPKAYPGQYKGKEKNQLL
jgi:hypothetical protein